MKSGKMAHQTGGRHGVREGGGRHTHNTGGSMAFTENTPKSKGSGIPKGNADVRALGRAAGGKIETMKGKNVR